MGWVGLKRWPLWCCGCSLTLRGPLAPRHSPPCPGLLLLVVAVVLVAVVAPLQGGVTPLWVAAQKGHTEVVAALVAAGALIDQAVEVGGMAVR